MVVDSAITGRVYSTPIDGSRLHPFETQLAEAGLGAASTVDQACPVTAPRWVLEVIAYGRYRYVMGCSERGFDKAFAAMTELGSRRR